MTITNRDPGDETTYEPCGETVYAYATEGDIYPSCHKPKGHTGKHSSWYTRPEPEGGWGRKNG